MSEVGIPEEATNSEKKSNPIREVSKAFLKKVREAPLPVTSTAAVTATTTLLALFQGDVTTALMRGVIGGALVVGIDRLMKRNAQREAQTDQRRAQRATTEFARPTAAPAPKPAVK